MYSMRNTACDRCATVETATPCMGACPARTERSRTFSTVTCPVAATCPNAVTCPVAATCPNQINQTAAYALPRCGECGQTPCACPETRESALRRVQQYGFMTDELRLFLNTHAECEEALAALKRYLALEKAAKTEFEKRYGSLTLETVAFMKDYDWIDCPWPWHVEE